MEDNELLIEEEEEEYESDTEDEDEYQFWSPELICRLIVVLMLSIILGLYLSNMVIEYYFLPTPNQDWPLPPDDVAVRMLASGDILLMWEPSPGGFVQHYRVYRWNNFLNRWKELPSSPTQKLGMRDSFLPGIWNDGTKIKYKVVAENNVNQSHPVELWYNLGYPELNFDLPTTSRAPEILSTPLRLMDISFTQGDEKIHIEWDRPPEKVLGFEVYRYNKILKVYDKVEKYDSIRNYSRCKMPNYPIGFEHCFVVKSVSWGDIGTSAPSYERCIYIDKWAWDIDDEDEKEKQRTIKTSRFPKFQQLAARWGNILKSK